MRSRKTLYFLWLSALFLQAFFTELSGDEAYYWNYSRELSWGYFDHPPAIALLVKIGYFIFPNELGVRFLPILLSTLTIYIWEKLIYPERFELFFLMTASVAIVHFVGFMALPDAPLLFFSSLFLLLYRRFLLFPGTINSLLLGITAACMILSKYHALLFLVLILLSNLKLVKSRNFWLIVITTLLLLIPHIAWQVRADFPSVKYHLTERNVGSYLVSDTLEYLGSLLYTFGPFTGIFFFAALIIEKAKGDFEKSMKYLFWGAYLFFFIMTFKGRVEAHWTLMALVPGLYFTYKFFSARERLRRAFSWLCVLALAAIIGGRVLASFDLNTIFPDSEIALPQDFSNKKRILLIKKQAMGVPVAFMNSYKYASLYSFYAAAPGFSVNNIMGRKSQFDIWNYEEKYRGGKIMLVPNYEVRGWAYVEGLNCTQYVFIENFQSFSFVRIIPINLPKEMVCSDTLSVQIILNNDKNPAGNFDANPDQPSVISYQFFEGSTLVQYGSDSRVSNAMLNKPLCLKIITPQKAGKYDMRFSIQTGLLPPTINSKRYRVLLVADPAAKRAN